MRLAVKSRRCGSGIGLFLAASRATRGFVCRIGMVVARPCRSSKKVQVCRKSAGGAGAAGGAGRILRGMGVLAGIALLAACAGKVEPKTQYVRVEVPVQVPCRAPEVEVPPWATADLRETDSLEVKVRALLAERWQRIGYEKQLKVAASSCR